MKYIIVDCMGLETPIIFEEIIDHSFVAQGFGQVISAGFVKIYGDETPLADAICAENAMTVSVWGESKTLKLKSRPEDEEIIYTAIHRHYK